MRIAIFENIPVRRRVVLGALTAAALTVSIGSAATFHRFASVPASATSEGAVGYDNSSPSGSAIEGTVSASGGNSAIKIPFGVLGEYEASTSTFGVGVIGLSSSGYGVGAETFSSAPAIVALNGGAGDGIDIGPGTSGDGVSIVASSSGYPLYIKQTNSGFGAGEYVDVSDSTDSGIGILINAGPNIIAGFGRPVRVGQGVPGVPSLPRCNDDEVR